jgi:hypothetical protein
MFIFYIKLNQTTHIHFRYTPTKECFPPTPFQTYKKRRINDFGQRTKKKITNWSATEIMNTFKIN